MADEEKIVQDPQIEESAATPETPSESSPAVESSNEDAKKEGSQTEGKDLSVEELREKYSASSKEARLLKEEKEREMRRAEELQQELLAAVTKDRPTFETYLDNKGLTPDEKVYYMSIYDTQIAPQKGNAETSPQATKQPEQVLPSTQPANPIRESWMSQKDQEVMAKFEAQVQASKEFFNRDDNKDLSPAARNAIVAQAEYFDIEKGMTPAEALAAARKVVLSPEEIQEEGYVEAVRDSMVGITRGVSGSGSGSKGSAFTLPKKHQAFVEQEIRNRGLKDKEAEEYRQAYALRLARKSE